MGTRGGGRLLITLGSLGEEGEGGEEEEITKGKEERQRSRWRTPQGRRTKLFFSPSLPSLTPSLSRTRALCCSSPGTRARPQTNSIMSGGIARGRLAEERKAWRKNHPHVSLPQTPFPFFFFIFPASRESLPSNFFNPRGPIRPSISANSRLADSVPPGFLPSPLS